MQSPIEKSSITPDCCKICGSAKLDLRGHTARCQECGVLLYFPYPTADEPQSTRSTADIRAEYIAWAERSAYRSHRNFTDNILFTIPPSRTSERLRILDFGGGGGQFALVAQSHLPHAELSIVDVSEDTLLEACRPLNHQIAFDAFPTDETRFDYIFMNDVFEHVSDPIKVLRMLRDKLAPGGRIFIDTPRQFWLYPILRALPFAPLYEKLLAGTVTKSHLQIWSDTAFDLAAAQANCVFEKRSVDSALTMDADFYLDNMGIQSGPLRRVGQALHAVGRFILRNKIFCILSAAPSGSSDSASGNESFSEPA